MNPFPTFLAIHFEVGGNTSSLRYQKECWPAVTDLVSLAEQYAANLTLQFNPQWAEYILEDQNRFGLLKRWQERGHEIGLHHHGYDHGDWNGFTNRPDKDKDPRYRGGIPAMMKTMQKLAHPYELLSATTTDEEFDHPAIARYDTEGIRLHHARSKPKRVRIGGKNVIQVSMALMSVSEDIVCFKHEYLETMQDEIFGVVTHEKDFMRNPALIEEWFKFVKSQGAEIRTVCDIISAYKKAFDVKYDENPLIFSKDVAGIAASVQSCRRVV